LTKVVTYPVAEAPPMSKPMPSKAGGFARGERATAAASRSR